MNLVKTRLDYLKIGPLTPSFKIIFIVTPLYVISYLYIFYLQQRASPMTRDFVFLPPVSQTQSHARPAQRKPSVNMAKLMDFFLLDISVIFFHQIIRD
jgi:hypothetical protein